MDKKQQIEEMARLSCGYLKNDICIVKLKECDIDCGFAMTAEKIYTAGYRKIDDDCAVITKAELKQYEVQAVKDFLEKLEEKALSHCRTINCYERKFIEITIDELLKEYEK